MLYCLEQYFGILAQKGELNHIQFSCNSETKLVYISFFIFSFNFRRTQQDLFNAMGCMYAAVVFLGVQNASSVQPVVAVERTVFYRERAAGMYSALPYAFGQAQTSTSLLKISFCFNS